MSSNISHLKVVISGAGRDFGRTLAICLGRLGAELFISARNIEAVEKVRAELAAEGVTKVHVFACDLTNPASVALFGKSVAEVTPHIDVVVNNGAGWLEGDDLEGAADQDIVDTILSGAAGLVLMTKHFLPLLRLSSRPDIVNMVSSASFSNDYHCRGHAAFYASKGGQGRAAQMLSHRLRPSGIRVISMYPPDFQNIDPLDAQWRDHPRSSDRRLTAQSLVECIVFAIGQPRDCFIKAFEFETV